MSSLINNIEHKYNNKNDKPKDVYSPEINKNRKTGMGVKKDKAKLKL